MGYNLLINGVYWGYNLLTNLLLTSWDIQVVVFFFFCGGFGVPCMSQSINFLEESQPFGFLEV